MSTIQPQEKLRLLRELLLVEERQDIVALRERLLELEVEVEESSKRSLVDELKEQRPDDSPGYESYIAALQDGTESAIERSVRTNKKRLAGALFPIMGPAIRSYVAELFRNMAEDLNRTLQNATSVERLRWRFQARVQGVPFSEYVALRTANFQVEQLILMEQGTGLLIEHITSDPEHGLHRDPDLMTGMLTAIRSFARDVFGEDKNGDGEPDDDEQLHRFSFGDRQVLIEGSPTMVLGAVVNGQAPSMVRDKMKAVLEALHEQSAIAAESDSADVSPEPEERQQILEGALLEAHAPKKSSSGGGLWRAWLFLALVAGGLGWWIYNSVIENRRWDEFADNLRGAPGIEVLEADGSRIVGLRDPLAPDLITLAPEKIDLEEAELHFAPFHSLHPDFVARREAGSLAAAEKLVVLEEKATASSASLAALGETAAASATAMEKLRTDLTSAEEDFAIRLREAEALRRNQVQDLLTSRYAHLEQIEWEFSDNGVRVSGGAPEPYYSEVVGQLAALSSLGTIDTSEFRNLSGTTMDQVVSEFTRSLVLYESGELELLAEGATVAKLKRLIDQLDDISGRQGHRYDLRVRSHPLIGANREANKVIEQQRASDLRARLIEAGVAEARLTLELSNDESKAGHGVEVVPVKIEP